MYYLGTRLEDEPKAMEAVMASRQSSLSEVTKSLAYEDLCRAFLPAFLPERYKYIDRGLSLQEAWPNNAATFGSQSYCHTLTTATLRTWGEAAASGKIPGVIVDCRSLRRGSDSHFRPFACPTIRILMPVPALLPMASTSLTAFILDMIFP